MNSLKFGKKIVITIIIVLLLINVIAIISMAFWRLDKRIKEDRKKTVSSFER